MKDSRHFLGIKEFSEGLYLLVEFLPSLQSGRNNSPFRVADSVFLYTPRRSVVEGSHWGGEFASLILVFAFCVLVKEMKPVVELKYDSIPLILL